MFKWLFSLFGSGKKVSLADQQKMMADLRKKLALVNKARDEYNQALKRLTEAEAAGKDCQPFQASVKTTLARLKRLDAEFKEEHKQFKTGVL